MSQWTIRRITKDHLQISPTEFWDLLYHSLQPPPQCDFCQQAITDPKEWVSFKCAWIPVFINQLV